MIDTKVILFSTGCPKCMILSKKLDMAGVPYEVNTDVQELIDMGIMSVPVLKVEDDYLDFMTAIAWVNDFMEN